VVPRPPPVASFSLCGLRLFVIKRICLSPALLGAGPQRNSSPRGPRARRLLACLAWNLSSLTSSSRSSSLPAFLAMSFPLARLVVIKRIFREETYLPGRFEGKILPLLASRRHWHLSHPADSLDSVNDHSFSRCHKPRSGHRLQRTVDVHMGPRAQPLTIQNHLIARLTTSR